MRVTDIIKPNEMNHRTLAKASAWTRSLDNKIVEGYSEKRVAESYGIPIERVKKLNTNIFEDSFFD